MSKESLDSVEKPNLQIQVLDPKERNVTNQFATGGTGQKSQNAMDKYIGSPINAIRETATEQDEHNKSDTLLKGGRHSQSMTPKSMGNRGLGQRS